MHVNINSAICKTVYRTRKFGMTSIFYLFISDNITDGM